MFNNHAQQHKQSQLLNPFSDTGSGRASPKPFFSKDEYGKPLAGSLTEMRGQKANMHVLKEMLELCQIIASEGYNVNDEPNMKVIPFGELFNIYNYISDKVVGILLRARKHKLVEFEGEMLYQRRDDDVPIFLLKPVGEIRQELESKIDDIKRASSPAPTATSILMDRQSGKLSVPGSRCSSRASSPSTSPTRNKRNTSKEGTPHRETKIEITSSFETDTKDPLDTVSETKVQPATQETVQNLSATPKIETIISVSEPQKPNQQMDLEDNPKDKSQGNKDQDPSLNKTDENNNAKKETALQSTEIKDENNSSNNIENKIEIINSISSDTTIVNQASLPNVPNIVIETSAIHIQKNDGTVETHQVNENEANNATMPDKAYTEVPAEAPIEPSPSSDSN